MKKQKKPWKLALSALLFLVLVGYGMFWCFREIERNQRPLSCEICNEYGQMCAEVMCPLGMPAKNLPTN